MNFIMLSVDTVLSVGLSEFHYADCFSNVFCYV